MIYLPVFCACGLCVDELDGDDETAGIVCSQHAVALGNLGTAGLPAGLELVVEDSLCFIEGIRSGDRGRKDFSPEDFGSDCLDHFVFHSRFA